jgi:type 1 fimbriae regulatory protein FimB
LPEALSREQLLSLLRCARASRERDWLMILVAFSHGLRASEVIGLTRDDIADGHLNLQRLKGSLRTVQPLMEDADPLLNESQALADYAASFLGNQRLFPVSRQRFWQIMQQHCRTARIPERLRHPHVLKHTIAMQTIPSAGIENVQQYLGHKSISSTGAYLKVSDAVASSKIADALKGPAVD